ncbi:spore germination protein, partial [Bacillus velezensis]
MPPFFKQKKQKKADQNDRGNEDRKEPENKSDKEREEPISLSLEKNMKKLSARFGNS